MGVIYILLPLTLLIVAGALVMFIWAVKDDQFEDLETPAIRMLIEDEEEKN